MQELAKNPLTQMVAGFGYPIRAIKFMRTHKLFSYAAGAIAINIALFLVFVWSFSVWVLPFFSHADGAAWIDSDWWRSTWDTVGGLVSFLMFSAGIILGLALGAIIILVLGQAIASPFLERLSERIEEIQLGTPSQPFKLALVLRGVAMAVSDVFWAILLMIALQGSILLLAGWLPPLASVLSTLAAAFIVAHEFITLPLSRRLVPYRPRLSLAWKQKWWSFGFGSSTLLLLFIPGLNLILLPAAAAGGTLLYCDLKTAGRLN